MKHIMQLLWVSAYLLFAANLHADSKTALTPQKTTALAAHEVLQCIDFSPNFIGSVAPADMGAIENQLDKLIANTQFSCIMTYGVTDGLEQIFPAAEARNMRVIAIIWLDKDPKTNSRSISAGIKAAKTYPKTIFRLSCGSEVRSRHGKALDSEILRCLNSLRKAGVSQPLTSIDSWWQWCDKTINCKKSLLADKVDWIGVNVFPWWENKLSSVYPCTTAEQAAEFHIARLQDLSRIYPGKELILTHFGWPNGPEGTTEVNIYTRQRCGLASPINQKLVVDNTFKMLAEHHWTGVVLGAFSEYWMPVKMFPELWLDICKGTAVCQ